MAGQGSWLQIDRLICVSEGECCMCQANQVKLMWAATGQALLALTSSDSDPTNRSYYGDAKLHFLSADGRNDVLVQLKVATTHWLRH